MSVRTVSREKEGRFCTYPACPRLEDGAGGRPDVGKAEAFTAAGVLRPRCARCGCALAGAGPSCPGTLWMHFPPRPAWGRPLASPAAMDISYPYGARWIKYFTRLCNG
ncbi:hypothetical protein [Azospirillum melinis]